MITLSIIGVISALTIPSLIAKNREKETVVRLKKGYNVLSQAYSMAIIDNGSVQTWGWTNDVNNASDEDKENMKKGANSVYEKLSPYLNIARYCKSEKGCFSDVKTIIGIPQPGAGQNASSSVTALLTDGSSISIGTSSSDCSGTKGSGPLKNFCGGIRIDINGPNNGPNTQGKDVFGFWATKETIVPEGTSYEIGAGSVTNCNIYGRGCTAWVLIKENMDYLKGAINW